MAGLENPLETTRNTEHPEPELANVHIRLGSPPFFICLGGDPRTRIPILRPTPPHYSSETGSRDELHQPVSLEAALRGWKAITAIGEG